MRYLMTVLLLAALTVSVGCKKSRNPGMATLPPPEPQQHDGDMIQVIGDSQNVTIPDPMPAPQTAQYEEPVTVQPTSYTIRKGDTLWSISRQVYGNGNRWQDIASANNIANPKKLRVGQTLLLPQ